MNWLNIGILSQTEPSEPRYRGERDHCACCNANIFVDDIHSDHRRIKGLGRVCVTCFLKEVESQDLEVA